MCNPFFAFGGKLIYLFFPSIRMAHKMNPNAYTFEYKPKVKNVPEHIYPWLYDFNNPIQRKRFPVRTLLEMENEIQRIQSLIKRSEA
mmetsp:Transcript_12345/g.20751  ORF Transcript_12345/g.20751 Transcript_12345/m.20751 type:complete len:87 (+) Transcript_12345:67-327(+)